MNIMDNPLLSVIIPVFNVEKYLSRCLESVCKQSMEAVEILCINDGSTDASLEKIKFYAKRDKRFKIINKINTGYGNTVNVGIKSAKGKYIGIIESDDFVEAEMFIKLYTAAEKSNADVIKGNYNFYRESSKEKFVFNEVLKDFPYERVFHPMEYEQVFDISASVWSAIYKKEFLEKNNIMFTETPGASYQDTSFTFKVFQYADTVYFIKDAVINYRLDNADSSVHNPKKIFCVCSEFQEIENSIAKDKNQKRLFRIIKRVKFHSYLWNYRRMALPYQYTFLLKFAEEFRNDIENGLLDKQYFSEDDWKNLIHIIYETDSYFIETAKDFCDPRMEYIDVLNWEFDFWGLNHCINKFDKIYIYGAGKIADEIWKYFIKIKKEEKICGFVVSDSAENISQIDDKKVLEISEINAEKDHALLIVAVKQNNQYEIVKKLEAMSFKNIVLATKSMRKRTEEL